MSQRIGIVEEQENDLAWKFAKLLAGGSILTALLWWNPIPVDVLLQIVLVLVLPILLVSAFIGLVSYDLAGTAWNEFASGNFAKRVETHLKNLRAQAA